MLISQDLILSRLLNIACILLYGPTALVMCRGHPDIDRPVLSFWEEANLVQAEQEEAHLVREFKERLRYNLQQVQDTVIAV